MSCANFRREGESDLDWFNRYVMNDIPIRLIRLSDMKLVGRNDVRMHFQSSVPQDNDNPFSYDPSLTVKYAILSHRWLNEGEPTHGEMESGKATGPGYEKLKKFCERAQEHLMEFAWSDTCCIDKTSSTELDESIRSMFRWYSNSEICIVHLAQSETIEDIMDDEWMQRGWTLQELLAPFRIKLFNKHWMPMTSDGNDRRGKNTEVMMALGRATGIPLRELQNFSQGPYNVDERMTWAARRKTTRVEDVAYSLMGIFDISLQIAYGEGGERAFCRLIEALMQAGDPTVLNWRSGIGMHQSVNVIPGSPQSYAGQTLRFPSGLWRLDMTMTSQGLRMPLVIFPLSVTSTVTQDSEIHVTAECLLCPTIKVNFVEWSTDTNFTISQYALGIVNYSRDLGAQPQIRGKSAAFILRRYRKEFSSYGNYICQPESGDFIGLKTGSPPEYGHTLWKNVLGHGLIEINFPNIPDNSFFFVDNEYLEVVYL